MPPVPNMPYPLTRQIPPQPLQIPPQPLQIPQQPQISQQQLQIPQQQLQITDTKRKRKDSEDRPVKRNSAYFMFRSQELGNVKRCLWEDLGRPPSKRELDEKLGQKWSSAPDHVRDAYKHLAKGWD
jgi:hypothetical protein